MQMLEEQCIREGYHQSSYSPVKFTGSGRVSITLDPDSILGWDWSYYGVNYDFVSNVVLLIIVVNYYIQISEDSINYFKVMGCEDGEVTSDDIEMLDLLEHKCSYPPRFRLKFEPDKIAYNIRSHNVTVTFNNVTPPTTATITLPGICCYVDYNHYTNYQMHRQWPTFFSLIKSSFNTRSRMLLQKYEHIICISY